MFGFEGMSLKRKRKRIVLDSSMVEHAAVNRGVVGSSPTRGGKMNNLYETCRRNVYRFCDYKRKYIITKVYLLYVAEVIIFRN